MSEPRRSRVPLVMVALILAGAGVASSVASNTNSATLPTGLRTSGAIESAALYCTGFTGHSGVAPASVWFFNTSSHDRLVDATIASGRGAERDARFIVHARRVFVLAHDLFSGSAMYAVSAVVDGGGVSAVTRGTAANATSAPCATTGATRWSFAGVTTHVGNRVLIAIVNPTSTQVVANVTASTPSGFLSPESFQGIVIGARGVVTVDVGAGVVNAAPILVHVTAVHGTVVAVAVQTWNNSSSGPSILTGSPGPSRSALFPEAPTSEGIVSTLVIANPGAAVNHLTVRVGIPGYVIAPFRRDVGPFATTALVVSPNSRVPPAGPAALRVTGTSPFVATLVITQKATSGVWMSSPIPSTRAQVVDDRDGEGLASLTVLNPSARLATVVVRAVGISGQLTHVIRPRGRWVLLSSALSNWSGHVILITSDVAVAAAGSRNGASAGAILVGGSGGR